MAITADTDVEARWRPLSDPEKVVAATRIEDAERRLRAKIPDLVALAAADPDYEATVIQVVADAVIRVLKNPNSKSSEQIDDYKWTRDKSVSDGALRITSAEWASLGVTTAGPSGKAFSIDTTPAAAVVRRS